MTDIFSQFRACPLLAGFPDEALHQAARLARIRRCPAGEMIYRKGELQSCLCVIAEGSVRINSVNSEGREAILIALNAGTWFGDAVFVPGAGRVYGATAHTDAVLVELPGPAFHELLQRFPEAYPAVVENISRRLWSAMTLIEEDALRNTTARIGRRLLFLCEMQRGGGAMGEPVTLNLTREHIANLMGMTRQGVHRTLKQFEQAGLISLGYGFIIIHDEQSLLDFLEQ